MAHLGELIRAYLEQSSSVPDGMDIGYNWEDQPSGTAGAIRELEPPEGPLLVMNGDILTTLDYRELISFHEEQGAALTIAAHRKDVKIELGVIEGALNDVTGYIEKPTLSYEVSMGIYVYGPEAVARIPAGRFDFPDLVLALIDEGLPVRKVPPSTAPGTTSGRQVSISWPPMPTTRSRTSTSPPEPGSDGGCGS